MGDPDSRRKILALLESVKATDPDRALEVWLEKFFPGSSGEYEISSEEVPSSHNFIMVYETNEGLSLVIHEGEENEAFTISRNQPEVVRSPSELLSEARILIERNEISPLCARFLLKSLSEISISPSLSQKHSLTLECLASHCDGLLSALNYCIRESHIWSVLEPAEQRVRRIVESSVPKIARWFEIYDLKGDLPESEIVFLESLCSSLCRLVRERLPKDLPDNIKRVASFDPKLLVEEMGTHSMRVKISPRGEKSALRLDLNPILQELVHYNIQEEDGNTILEMSAPSDGLLLEILEPVRGQFFLEVIDH